MKMISTHPVEDGTEAPTARADVAAAAGAVEGVAPVAGAVEGVAPVVDANGLAEGRSPRAFCSSSTSSQDTVTS